ncbi:hypothetical protein Vretimale_18006 [Volvox reticuliferus]|uniref:Uncharacterized protein n=1 Tax=Volvox reticuliferus TaxID=1737510 RepID=A0A8J4GX43_9CHLO|nr:hypothetical protein Vretimale_18006 [Volvox reticuliferus]
MPITNCEATPQTPAPGCCPTRLLEQSLTDLMQRLCSSTWALSAREADAVVAVVSDVLLQSSAATERELILALSCTAMLSTRQGAGTALMAARGNLSHQANGAPSHLAFASADASNTTVVSSSPPSDALSTSGPAVLPLLPLLAAVAAGDEAAAEMALRRLNRCLGRPLSAANPIAATTVQCAATNTPSIRSNRIWSSNGDGQGGGEDLLAGCYADTTLGSLSSLLLAPEDDGEFRSLVRGEWEGARGSLASSRGGGDDSVCSSGALAAASWESARYRSRCCLSLLAAQQAEARLVVEAERCKLAAARLCGCRARSEAAAAEAESLQGACVAALAAAAADVRCHQELLGSLALKALPRLLSSSATAPYAAVLAHNLAVPTSVCFRHQLRRRGVLPPLFDYLGHLTPPPSTPPHHQHYHQQQQQCPGLVQDLAEGAIAAVNLTGLTVVLEAITCLCAGREGADALRQPQLDALKRLGALWERLEAVTKPSWCSRGPQSVGLSGGSGSGTNKATGSYDGEALLTVHRLLNGLLERLPVEVPLEPSGCGRVAPDRGLEVKAPRADRGRVGRRGEQRDGRRTAANTGGANVGTGEEASASCLSFQSQVRCWWMGGRCSWSRPSPEPPAADPTALRTCTTSSWTRSHQTQPRGKHGGSSSSSWRGIN